MVDGRLMLDCIHKHTAESVLIGQSNLLESIRVLGVPLTYRLLHYFIPSYQCKSNRVFIFPSRMLEHLKFPEFHTVTLSYNLIQHHQIRIILICITSLTYMPAYISTCLYSTVGVRAFFDPTALGILKELKPCF